MALGFGKNILSLGAQRRLNQVTESLSISYERLGSGLRINRVSDDAAGLSVASSLQADSRVYTQAIKNIHDGISLLNIAQGALFELSSVAARQQELAEQGANGVYSLEQRKALNDEAQALSDEWNRIVLSTSFNGVELLDGSLTEGLRIQAGYGTDGSISFAVGHKLARTVGTGTLASSGYSHAVGTTPSQSALGDVSGDGFSDMVVSTDSGICVLLGNNDGSFSASSTFAIGGGAGGATLSDINRDGLLDVVTFDQVADRAAILLGNGNGSFKAAYSYALGSDPADVEVVDLNEDGSLDIVSVNMLANSVSVLIGNGDGSFRSKKDYATGARPTRVESGDFNGDGISDIIATDSNDGAVSVLLGNGDGSLRARISVGVAAGPNAVEIADFNRDGSLDFATSGYYGSVSVVLGNGDGTFKAQSSLARPGDGYSLDSGDLNGDGIIDLVASDYSARSVSTFIGNGDGSFKARTSLALATDPFSVQVSDVTGDDVSELLVSMINGGRIDVFRQNTAATPTASPLDLLSQASSRDALTRAQATQSRVSAELGAVGAMQSRLGTALRTLITQRENYATASSRITDADIAQESASLVASQIRQKVASSILAQANQSPQIALQLLAG